MSRQPPASPAATDRPADAVWREGLQHLLARPPRPLPPGPWPPADAAALARLRALGIPAHGRPLREVLDQLLDEILPQRARVNDPRFMAFVPGPASPLSALGAFITALDNPQAGSAHQNAGPAQIEADLIRWMADQLGLPERAGGLFVSGGSMANLTALTVARDCRLPVAERSRGVAYASDQTHASVARALHILGFSPEQLRCLPSDDDFRLAPASLAQAVAEDRRAGRLPFLVVASAGSTPTGSIDPLPAVHTLCAREGLWLHVDGALGASVALVPGHRALLSGIEQADSVTWDAHKWLFQSYNCGVVLLRDAALLPQSFHLQADYLDGAEDAPATDEPWHQGPELSRPARALKLWLTLQVMGREGMSEAIEQGCRLARWAQDELGRQPHWEIVTPAQLAILTFRVQPPRLGGEQTDALNRQITRQLQDEGVAALMCLRLRGRVVIRLCALHPETTERQMRETVRRLQALACAAMAGG